LPLPPLHSSRSQDSAGRWRRPRWPRRARAGPCAGKRMAPATSPPTIASAARRTSSGASTVASAADGA